MVQEVYDTHPALREVCKRSITGHAAILVPDIEEAIRQRDMQPEWTAESLALYTQASIQGAFILAKATRGVAVAGECIDHLRRSIELLFHQPQAANEKTICLEQQRSHAPISANSAPAVKHSASTRSFLAGRSR
jgi:TetR/AcrR family transcriptional repressor of nem operon